MQDIDTLNDCEAWVIDRWKRISVTHALKHDYKPVRCYKCHGHVVLMKESHDGSKQAHAEHRPRHRGCPLTHKFIPGTPFSLSPHPVKSPLGLEDSSEEFSPLPDSYKRIPKQDDASAFPEGKRKFKQHYKLERDSAFMRKLKAQRLADLGKLECEVCETDFVALYGAIGKGFIEGHHKVPVSQIDGTEKTYSKDIAFVCSNCHRMLHRAKPLLTVEQLRETYLLQSK